MAYPHSPAQKLTEGISQFDTIIGEADCVDKILTDGAKTHIPCLRRKVKNGELLYDTPGRKCQSRYLSGVGASSRRRWRLLHQ